MPNEEIEALKQKFVDRLNPVGIYLFGSFAKGTAQTDSDFDFYIVVDDKEKDLHAVAASAYKAIRHLNRRSVDILVGTKSRFSARKELPTIENEVYRTGVLLYGTVC